MISDSQGDDRNINRFMVPKVKVLCFWISWGPTSGLRLKFNSQHCDGNKGLQLNNKARVQGDGEE